MDITRIEDAKVVLNDITSKTPIVHATKIHDNYGSKLRIYREQVLLSCVEHIINYQN